MLLLSFPAPLPVLLKIGSGQDNEDLRAKIHADRDLAKQSCTSIHAALQRLQGSQMQGQLTREFRKEAQRFERISTEIKNRDSAVLTAYGAKGGRASGASGGAAAALESGRGGVGADYGSRDDRRAGGGPGSDQQQLLARQQDEFAAYDLEDMRRRRQEIEAIERDVVEIHEMTVDLNTMVTEQGERLTFVDEVLTSAKDKTEAAYGELQSAEDYQKRARRKKCCLMVILIVVVAAIALGIWKAT